MCKVRGKLRGGHVPLVGDRVAVTAEGPEGVVERVMPRRNELKRPRVANVDQAVVVFTVREPRLNELVVERLLVQAEEAGVEVVMCLNKIDLVGEVETAAVERYWKETGYPFVKTSAKLKLGLDLLRQYLEGRVSVLSGESGVGKSTLVNALEPGLQLRTGEIRKGIKRGKRTTRHVELLRLDEVSWIVDTPGFNYVELPGIQAEELSFYFPGMRDVAPKCRFPGCLHVQEPDCAVKTAVENGRISRERYRDYLRLLDELKERRRY